VADEDGLHFRAGTLAVNAGRRDLAACNPGWKVEIPLRQILEEIIESWKARNSQ
jgi:hypothetical protein